MQKKKILQTPHIKFITNIKHYVIFIYIQAKDVMLSSK